MNISKRLYLHGDTKETSFCILDATSPDFFPGKKLPLDWIRDLVNGPWCFLPIYALEAPYFGGTAIREMRKFPVAYSPGYSSKEEALEAAKKWQDKISNRKTYFDADLGFSPIQLFNGSAYT